MIIKKNEYGYKIIVCWNNKNDNLIITIDKKSGINIPSIHDINNSAKMDYIIDGILMANSLLKGEIAIENE